MEKYQVKGTKIFYGSQPTPRMEAEARRLQFSRDVAKEREKVLNAQYKTRVLRQANLPEIQRKERKEFIGKTSVRFKTKTGGLVKFLVRDLAHGLKGRR